MHIENSLKVTKGSSWRFNMFGKNHSLSLILRFDARTHEISTIVCCQNVTFNNKNHVHLLSWCPFLVAIILLCSWCCGLEIIHGTSHFCHFLVCFECETESCLIMFHFQDVLVVHQNGEWLRWVITKNTTITASKLNVCQVLSKHHLTPIQNATMKLLWRPEYCYIDCMVTSSPASSVSSQVVNAKVTIKWVGSVLQYELYKIKHLHQLF